MKKICLITKYLEEVHNCSGGMEAHIRDLVEGLKKRNVNITIISSRHPGGISYEKRESINYIYVDGKITRNPFSRYNYMRKVGKKLKEINYEKKFDLIHVQSDFGINYFNKMKKKLPLVTTIHGTTIDEFFGSIKAKPHLIPLWLIVLSFYFKTERKMVKKSDKIISVSEITRKDLIKQQNIDKNKVKTIFNGIDINKFKPLKNKETERLRRKFANKDEAILLSVGNIIKQKGYHIIIKILPELLKHQKIKLVIVGSGDYLEELKKLTERLGLDKKVIFIGKVPRNKLTNYYNIGNFFVFPSLRGEGLPYVLIEAMACGLIPITCLNGGIGNICNEKNSILVNPKNQEEMKNKILEIMDNKKKQEELKKQGLKDVKKKFSLKNMVKENINTYNEVLK